MSTKNPFKVKPTTAETVRTVEAHYDRIKEWDGDPTGYFLIRLNEGRIEAGFCKKGNVVEILVVGDTAQKVVNTIIREKITLHPQHLADLGMELQKAEIALNLGISYVQDDPLDLTTVKQ